MSSEISLGDQFLWVSNNHFCTLIEFALQVAAERPAGSAFVERLRNFYEKEYWNGCGFDLAERFPDIEEQKFWCVCFFDIARRIFLKQLGNQDSTSWQSGAIGDAYIIARMLYRAIREKGIAWIPQTEDGAAYEAEHQVSINVRL